MIDALIGGRIHGAPAERNSAAGTRYAAAKVRVPTRAGDALFVNVITFDETAMTALLALSDHDSVAIAGELTPKVWTDKDGTARPSLDLVAHQVTTEYHVSRKRQAVREPA